MGEGESGRGEIESWGEIEREWERVVVGKSARLVESERESRKGRIE